MKDWLTPRPPVLNHSDLVNTLTTLLLPIHPDDESCHRLKVQNVIKWSEDNLFLYISKTKGNDDGVPPPSHHNSTEVKMVSSKGLGVTIKEHTNSPRAFLPCPN